MTDEYAASTVTIVVADDHPMVRRGLVVTLEDEPDFKVVAEAGSGLEAVSLVRTLHPRLVILDVNMPSSGLEASRVIKTEFPHILTVMFTFRQDPEIVRASRAAGANGYIVKGASGSALIGALRAILAGHEFLQLDPTVAIAKADRLTQ